MSTRRDAPEVIEEVTNPGLLKWAWAFIRELADEQDNTRHDLADISHAHHVALAQLVPKGLRHRTPAIRCAAAWVAGAADILSDETVPLLMILLSDRDPLVQMAAAWACGELGEDAAGTIASLAVALRDGPDGVRFAVAGHYGTLVKWPNRQSKV